MQITQMLQRLETGDREVVNVVIPLVYDELKKLAKSHLRREGGPVSLETTALVHEAFLRLTGVKHPSYESRAHFFGIASRLMRQILVDAARSRAAEKRGTSREIALAQLPEWGTKPDRLLLAMDDTLRELEKADPLKAQLIDMKFFGGMTAEETAVALGRPVQVVRRELRMAQAWLRKEMAAGDLFSHSSTHHAKYSPGLCNRDQRPVRSALVNEEVH